MQTGEITKRQVVTRPGGGVSTSRLPASYDTYRKIRKHPTVALARALSTSAVVAAEWSVEADEAAPEDWVQFIKDQFTPIREMVVEQALLGGCDFGHQGWEKVFAVRSTPSGARMCLAKLKPLLQDSTEILADPNTGAFAGFKQQDVVVPLDKCLLVPFRVEGTNWYGEPLLEHVRETYNWWIDANGGATRYDRKVAGSHWVIHYPPGESPDEVGSMTDNGLLAKGMLDALEASGSIAISDQVASYVDQLNQGQQTQAWRIELLTGGGGQQPTFIDRLRYLDTLMVRGMLLPERSVLEGQFGTLAESAVQTDFALTNADLTHRHVTRHLNWYAVDQLLVLNFGEAARGAVWLNASPIRDTSKTFLKEIYRAVLAHDQGFMEEFGLLDMDALKDAIGVPKLQEDITVPPPAGGEAPAYLPVPGVDANAAIAATIRRIYASIMVNGGR